MIKTTVKKKIKHLQDELYEEDYTKTLKIFGITLFKYKFDITHNTTEASDGKIGYSKK